MLILDVAYRDRFHNRLLVLDLTIFVLWVKVLPVSKVDWSTVLVTTIRSSVVLRSNSRDWPSSYANDGNYLNDQVNVCLLLCSFVIIWLLLN